MSQEQTGKPKQTGAIDNRLTTVETLTKLRELGYTEASAREYVKTGDVDKLRLGEAWGALEAHQCGDGCGRPWETR